ncbi:MAG: hypothetical protein ACE5F1_19685 [Planctomycetota bacterium]
MRDDAISLDRARAAKETAKRLLAGVPEVNGIGISRRDGGYVVKVNLERQPEDPSRLPAAIDGVPVFVHVAGRIRKQ